MSTGRTWSRLASESGRYDPGDDWLCGKSTSNARTDGHFSALITRERAADSLDTLQPAHALPDAASDASPSKMPYRSPHMCSDARGPRVGGACAYARSGVKREDTPGRSWGRCEVSSYSCQNGTAAHNELCVPIYQLTSPVCVNSCSANLDGLKYALSQPSCPHLNRLSTLEGGREGVLLLDADLGRIVSAESGESGSPAMVWSSGLVVALRWAIGARTGMGEVIPG